MNYAVWCDIAAALTNPMPKIRFPMYLGGKNEGSFENFVLLFIPYMQFSGHQYFREQFNCTLRAHTGRWWELLEGKQCHDRGQQKMITALPHQHLLHAIIGGEGMVGCTGGLNPGCF